jgi:1,4-dihydroxy-2-naphthoyl-CoA hydrolase
MEFSYYRTVRLSDTDAAGVVYFTRLLSICHEAYEASLEAAGIDLGEIFHHSSIALPIVHSSIDFLRPLFWGNKLVIHLSARQLSENEFEIDYLIHSPSSFVDCAAKAKTRHVCINSITRRRTALPEVAIAWLMQKSSFAEMRENSIASDES